jgi:hypothetical protein
MAWFSEREDLLAGGEGPALQDALQIVALVAAQALKKRDRPQKVAGLHASDSSVLFSASPDMADENKTIEAPLPELDERAIGKKYGLRELTYPDSEHIKSLNAFLTDAVENGRCGPVPKTAVMLVLDYLQATINRQHITKGPRMSQDEFDAIQAPYYIAARIIAKLQRARQESTKGKVYQATYISLNQFMEVLRSILDPGCYWMRMKTIPEGVLDAMEGLRDFLALFGEQRRKDRAP